MSISNLLEQRCGNTCELCGNTTDNMQANLIAPKTDNKPENQVALCDTCFTKIKENDIEDKNYWRCLSTSIWNENPAVQVLSYRMLQKMSDQVWVQELLETIYMDDETLAWANEGNEKNVGGLVHKDSNGNVLQSGDNVLLIQNLNVKGTNFIAPKGTKVLKIKLVHDNDEHIEGKINGSTIVILTKFVKKA